MNRKGRRQAKAKARRNVLDVGNGRIVTPLAGTTRFDANGRALGIWGQDFPCTPMLDTGQGEPRALSPAELRLVKQIYGAG